MNVSEIARRRLAQQHLIQSTTAKPDALVASFGAVQAQDYTGAKWALGQRIQNSTDSAIEAAFDRGEILRTHVLRPTWHFVTPDDILWMLELTAPRVNAFNRAMYRKMELDDEVFRKSRKVLTKALQGGKQLTRAELAAVLDRAGIADRDGIRRALLLMRAELDGVICSGPRRGKQSTYALLQERAPHAKKMKRDQALHELSMRYFSTRGPATARDFMWWSGLTLTDARKGFEMVRGELETAQVEQELYAFAPTAPPIAAKSPTAHLLPNYDEYFIGYQDRSAIGERIRSHSHDELNRALSSHILVMDGQIAGGWKRALKPNTVIVHVHLLAPLKGPEERALETAAARCAQFLGLDLELVQQSFDDKRRTNLFMSAARRTR